MAAGGRDWSNRENWLTDRPLEEWHGVQVDDEGRVIRLILGNNNLTGRIPAEPGSPTSLTVPDLAGNALTGPIPPELGSLAELAVLGLEHNGLTGPIPAELGGLTSRGISEAEDWTR